MDERADHEGLGIAADAGGEPFSRASELVGRIYDRALASAGVTGAEFTCLASLVAFDGASAAQLSHLMGADRDSVFEIVEALEKRGLVVTRRVARRPAACHVTRSGRDVHARAEALWREAQRRVTSAIGDAETRALVEALIEAETRLRKRDQT